MFSPPKTEYTKYIFNNGASFPILPDVNNSRFTSVTPNVANISFVLAGAIAPITITNLLKGSDFQSLGILGDGFTTMANNANIKTNTGANKLLAANKVYRFTHIDNVWYEDA